MCPYFEQRLYSTMFKVTPNSGNFEHTIFSKIAQEPQQDTSNELYTFLHIFPHINEEKKV